MPGGLPGCSPCVGGVRFSGVPDSPRGSSGAAAVSCGAGGFAGVWVLSSSLSGGTISGLAEGLCSCWRPAKPVRGALGSALNPGVS